MKDMNIYEVTFNNGTKRYYGFKDDCQISDTVVAGTSHGPLLGRITDILDELPDDHDPDKIRFILCKVPAVSEDAVVYHKDKLEKRMAALEQEMDSFIEREKKNYLRLVFSDYSDEFRELFDEYCGLEEELNHLNGVDQDIPDDGSIGNDDDDEGMDD